MSSSTNKKDTKEMTIKEKITSSLSTVKSMAIYILLGLTLCYLKIVLGDLSRDVKISHQTFTEGAFLVMRSTTPSVDFYCRENKTNYVKQAFVYNPNFIKDYVTNHFSTSGKDQLLKFISLECIYVLLSGVSMLDGIPNWVVILIGPIVYALIFLSMFFFMWLMLSYYIFSYFLSPSHIFSLLGMGWFVGFIVWLLVMIYFSVFTVPLAIIYGLIQFMYILRKADVRVLVPGNITTKIKNNTMLIDEKDSVPYGFMKFSRDMLLTSSIIQILICYTIYNIFNYFTIYSYVVIAFFALIFLFFRGPITFLKETGLEQNNWSSHTDSISLIYSETIMSQLKQLVGKGLKQLNDIGTSVANKAFGKENVDKIKDLVTNFSTDKANDLGKELTKNVLKKVDDYASKSKTLKSIKDSAINTFGDKDVSQTPYNSNPNKENIVTGNQLPTANVTPIPDSAEANTKNTKNP
jgi:hypothetical protein